MLVLHGDRDGAAGGHRRVYLEAGAARSERPGGEGAAVLAGVAGDEAVAAHFGQAHCREVAASRPDILAVLAAHGIVVAALGGVALVEAHVVDPPLIADGQGQRVVEDHVAVKAVGVAPADDGLALADPLPVDQIAAGEELHVHDGVLVAAPEAGEVEGHVVGPGESQEEIARGVEEHPVELAVVVVGVIVEQERLHRG